MSQQDEIYKEENDEIKGLSTRLWLTGVALIVLTLVAYLLNVA